MLLLFQKIKFTQVKDTSHNVPWNGVLRQKLKPKDYYLLSEFCLSFNGKKGHFMCIIIVLIHLVKELFKNM